MRIKILRKTVEFDEGDVVVLTSYNGGIHFGHLGGHEEQLARDDFVVTSEPLRYKGKKWIGGHFKLI